MLKRSSRANKLELAEGNVIKILTSDMSEQTGATGAQLGNGVANELLALRGYLVTEKRKVNIIKPDGKKTTATELTATRCRLFD